MAPVAAPQVHGYSFSVAFHNIQTSTALHHRHIIVMFNIQLKLFALTFSFFAFTKALSEVVDQALQLSSLPNLPEFYPSNQSNSSSGPSTENRFHVECDGDYFGYNLNIGDCQDAESYITVDSTQRTFAQRHTGMEQSAFPLPYRLMGGRCYISSEMAASNPCL